MNPKHPVYIISKGRWESRLTSKALEKMNVPYYIAVEPQEYDNYAQVIDPNKILVLPFSNHGFGSTPARNWCWEHSIQNGHTFQDVLDMTPAKEKVDRSWMFSQQGIENKARELGILGNGYDSYDTLKKKCMMRMGMEID